MSVFSWVSRKFGLKDGAAIAAIFGGGTWTGKSVTPDSALQIATVWACVRLIAETVATLPLGVFERGQDGRKVTKSDHPLYELLHNSPNADQTAVEFHEGMVACLLLWGNGYAEKVMEGSRLIALEPLRPDLMAVIRNADGERVYRYSAPSGRRDYGEGEILHIKGFGIGGDAGLSPVGYARQTLGSAFATDEAAARTFANGLRPSGWLTVDQVLKADQREQIKKTLLDPMTGAENAGRVGVLEAGMKWVPMALPPEDAQMLQTRGFHVEEICRWFRVPPFMVGHTEKTTSWGTGLESQLIAFLTFTLRPYLSRYEQAVRKQLVTAAERPRIWAEFNLEGLLRADSAGRATLYSTMVQNGIYTRNEIREKENLPPVAGGDVATAQSNLLPLDKLGQDSGSSAQARAALATWLQPLLGHNGGPSLGE